MTTCPTCGTGLDAAPVSCPACGQPITISTIPGDPYAASVAVIDDISRPRSDGPASDHYGIPFSVNGVLGAGFNLWARSLGRLLPLMAIPLCVMIGLGVGASIMAFDVVDSAEDISPTVGIWVGLGLLVVACLYLVASGGANLLLHDQALYGEKRRSAGRAFVQGFSYFWRLLGAAVILVLIAIGAVIPVIIAIALGTPLLGFAVSLGTFAIIFYVGIRWVAVQPLIVVENLGILAAISRSALLIKGRFWSVLGITLLFALILVGVFLVTAVLQFIPIIGQLIHIGINLLASCLSLSIYFAIYASLSDLQETKSG